MIDSLIPTKCTVACCIVTEQRMERSQYLLFPPLLIIIYVLNPQLIHFIDSAVFYSHTVHDSGVQRL
jgi:hypothetical protein